MTFTPEFISKFWFNISRKSDSECWHWERAINHNGYGVVRLNGKTLRSHRVAFEISVGSIPEELCVLHKCDVRNCCNPSHLFTGTSLDNQRDCISKGRAIKAHGERVGSAKMTFEKVFEIRRMYANGNWTHKKLAKYFGIGKSTIGYILNERNWKQPYSKIDERTEITIEQL